MSLCSTHVERCSVAAATRRSAARFAVSRRLHLGTHTHAHTMKCCINTLSYRSVLADRHDYSFAIRILVGVAAAQDIAGGAANSQLIAGIVRV